MSIRRMEYKKNGLDIRCRVEGSGEYSEGLILWKSYGDDKYIVIGKIYKTKNLNWTHQKGVIQMVKKSWHEAAKDLYAAFQVEAA
jgi:hypothetical protein